MLGAIIFANPVQASVKSDLIIGTVLILNGTAFKILETKESDKSTELEEEGNVHSDTAANALLNSAFFDGAAEWELLLNGQTSAYFNLLSQANTFRSTGEIEATTAIALFNDAGDHQDRENLFKGIWIASYGVGGVMILKGGITWYLRGRAPKTARVLQAVQIETVKSGGIATYSYRF